MTYNKNKTYNKNTEFTEEQLDSLLNELSFSKDIAPDPTLAARILATLPKASESATLRPERQHSGPGLVDRIFQWFGSPVRATFAYAVPLVLGLFIGTAIQNPIVADLLDTTDDYPLDDQMLVLAGYTDELTNELSMGFESGAAMTEQ